MDQNDDLQFQEAMLKLSMASSTELNEFKLEIYWEALSDLPMEGVVLACCHLARHWTPAPHERFPTPGDQRDVRMVREGQRITQARHYLTQASECPSEDGTAASSRHPCHAGAGPPAEGARGGPRTLWATQPSR